MTSGVTDSKKQSVLEEMHRVLESSEFHSSPRCQEFLRHIVEHCVEGSPELLKERNIGVDVFHRSPSYDPNNDAIVRVRATEVRKRLHQYYDHAGVVSGVRIALVAGSYVPEFQWVNPGAAPDPPSMAVPLPKTRAATPWWKRLTWVVGAVVCALLALALYRQFRVQSTPLHDFWESSLTSSKPVVVCLGQPVVYHLSRRVHENYLKTQPLNRLPGPYVIPLRDGDIEAADVLPVPDQYVGAGSAQTAANLGALLAGWKKPTQVRVGNEYSFYDLRDYPAVLVGAFNNDWTMKLSQRMPFVFFQEQGVRGIRETASPGSVWRLSSLQSNGRTSEDYALVGRVFDSGTMEPLVLVAGITQYGTQAAGEFISNEESFASAMVKAPKDWRTRNLQILLHLNVLGKVPGKPEVVAIRTW